YAAAMRHLCGPNVILAKSVKRFGMGVAGEGQNINHQLNKLGAEEIKAFRDRFDLDITDYHLGDMPFLKPAEVSTVGLYLKA
ncbi:hypothetical protein, partial [Pseudomonas syringae group genomosp. 7]|uniref:hypothetical protein n=1 Tax=Pseudomonas syringae group genomosp. 7 TaxID=251699 RepID=UPI0037704F62